jgi:hypothetical protein
VCVRVLELRERGGNGGMGWEDRQSLAPSDRQSLARDWRAKAPKTSPATSRHKEPLCQSFLAARGRLVRSAQAPKSGATNPNAPPLRANPPRAATKSRFASLSRRPAGLFASLFQRLAKTALRVFFSDSLFWGS